MKIETNLPIFPGFYNTIFEPNEESEIEAPYTFEDYTFDYETYRNDVGKACTTNIETKLKELGYDVKIKFLKIESPKYYNYSNDTIEVECKLTKKTLNSIIKYAKDNKEKFSTYIKERFTSYSGFTSFYSNDIDVWFDEYNPNEWVIFNTYLSFLLENEGHREEDLIWACESVYLNGWLKEDIEL